MTDISKMDNWKITVLGKVKHKSNHIYHYWNGRPAHLYVVSTVIIVQGVELPGRVVHKISSFLVLTFDNSLAPSPSRKSTVLALPAASSGRTRWLWAERDLYLALSIHESLCLSHIFKNIKCTPFFSPSLAFLIHSTPHNCFHILSYFTHSPLYNLSLHNLLYGFLIPP